MVSIGDSTIIVYFLTIGILLPPIVIFSFLLCGLASLDSNHPSFFLFFWLLAFLLFAFLHLRFCYHAPTKNYWFAGRPQAGWQKQRRDHDRSSSGFRRPWRQGCPGCVRGRPCYLRVSGVLSSGQMVFGEASFRFVVLYLGGRPPIMRVHFFDFPRRMTYPWRLLSRCMVQSSLSKSRLFFPIKTSLMHPRSRQGTDTWWLQRQSWSRHWSLERVLARHGVGNRDDNGRLLLEFCSEQ